MFGLIASPYYMTAAVTARHMALIMLLLIQKDLCYAESNNLTFDEHIIYSITVPWRVA